MVMILWVNIIVPFSLIWSKGTPHLTKTQTTMPSIPSRQLSIHALVVLMLQVLVHLLVFLACRGDTDHNRHTEPLQIHLSKDRSVWRVWGGDAGLITLAITQYG